MKRMFDLLAVLGLAGMATLGWAQIVTGTGSFTASVIRTQETLEPPCVQLITRLGQAEFSGLVTNSLGGGLLSSWTMNEACADPAQGTFRSRFLLTAATVAGVTGDLVIEAQGIFEGGATLPSRTRGHGTITGISGKLKGAKGSLQFVGRATATDSFNTYFAEIELKPGP